MTSFYYYDQNPSGFCFKLAVLLLNFSGITKLKYERKNVKDSGRSSKTTPSRKWPILPLIIMKPFFTGVDLILANYLSVSPQHFYFWKCFDPQFASHGANLESRNKRLVISWNFCLTVNSSQAYAVKKKTIRYDKNLWTFSLLAGMNRLLETERDISLISISMD